MIERDTPSANGRQEDLVLAITDVLLAGEGVDIADIAARYAVPPAQVRRYSQLIEQLHCMLLGARASPGFVRALKRDLLGEARSHWRWLALRAPLVLAGVALAGALVTASARRWRRNAPPADSPTVS